MEGFIKGSHLRGASNVRLKRRRWTSIQNLKWRHIDGKVVRRIIPVFDKREKMDPGVRFITGKAIKVCL